MLVRLFSLLALTLLIGCGRSTPPAPPPAQAQAPAEAAPAPPPGAAVAAPEAAPVDEAALNQLLGQLTQVARKFAAEQQRVPKSLDELVAGGYLSRVPAAPPGQAFTITKQLQVELRRR